ncbi:translocation/assembly module TamB domain-containing protein [Aquabacter cavernae]|uniref:translocation/assembly module TamB domain-containing protein n=1 Tax=Aquabacter cavernae TaxID=2496029 RepID=UPI001FE1732F|nr:translocation/assembly module TamB domain-containing protein [Aquabacter cavernae]
MRALRTALLSLAALMAVILVILGGLFGLAQTGFGRAYLAELASRLASGNGLKVEVSGLSGFVPSNLRVARIVLSDPDGPFASIDDLALRWQPSALLSGTVFVETLEAGRVDMQRAPVLPPAAPTSGGGRMPALRVVVDRLAAPHIVLGEALLGQPAELAFEAGLRLMEPSRGLSLRFGVKRLDAEGTVSGNVAYAPQSRTLDLDITAHEPPGGVVARLAHLEGLPALDANVKGAGSLDDWRGTLSATAGSLIRLDGTAAIRAAAAGGHLVTLTTGGELAGALPANVAPLFEGRSDLNAEIGVAPDFALDIRRLVLTSAGLRGEVSGTLSADRRANLAFTASLGEAKRFEALTPGISWATARASGTVRGEPSAPTIAALFDTEHISGLGYGARRLKITAGTAPGPARLVLLTATANAEGLSAQDPAVSRALGGTATASLRGQWTADTDPTLTDARVQLEGIDLSFMGRAGEHAVRGRLDLARLDLAALSPLAGRPLKGIVALKADIVRDGRQGEIGLDGTGTGQGIATGDPALDGIVAGDVRFSGGLSYAPGGAVTVRRLEVTAPGATLSMDGRIDTTTANLAGTATLPDLARIDPRVTGAARVEAAFTGRLAALGVTARATVPQGTAMGRPVRDLALDLTARDLTGRPAGTAGLTGSVGGKQARGAMAFATADDGGRSLSGLDLALGSARLTGDLAVAPTGLATGQLAFSAKDLSDLTPVLLQEVSGRADARVRLDGTGGAQRVAVDGTMGNLVASGQRVDDARFDFTVGDPRTTTDIAGTVEARGIVSGGVDIEHLKLAATPGAGGIGLTLDAAAQGAQITAAGRAAAQGEAQTFRLDTLRVTRERTTVALSAPATFTYRDGATTLDKLALTAGGGTLVAQGRFGDTLDLSLDARAIPLALAAMAQPGLALSGTANASARITGTPAAPAGRYDVTISRLNAPEIAAAGVGPYDIRANGTLDGGRARVNATISGPSLSGVTVNGSVPVSGGDLDLAVRGTISLAIANAMLATTGARAGGNAALDVTLRGTFAEPRAGGTVRITNGRYEDAPNGVTIERIEAVLTGTDRSVTLTSLRAGTPNGGTIQAQGNVALDPGAGFPGRVDVTLNNAGLVNSEMIRFVTDGRVALGGAFASRPTVGGRIDVRALDVNLPDRIPGGSAANVKVRHVNLPKGLTPASPRPRAGRGAQSSGAFVTTLDLTVSAPNRVFVRGMGMEAEMGGTLQLRGTSAEPVTVGSFEMYRGRLDILGRRLDFTRGRLTFNGSTDPDLDFIAESTAGDVTARIIIAGRASEPEVSFSSTPALPQDEVVARLLFGRPTGQLSAGQALQVAQAVATLSGAGQGSLGALRRSLGLDSLDVGMNAAGTGGQIGLGRRLNDNISLGVRQGTNSNSTQATIDIDLGRNIRLQGATGADGGTSVGIGAQWDY